MAPESIIQEFLILGREEKNIPIEDCSVVLITICIEGANLINLSLRRRSTKIILTQYIS